MTKTFGGLTPTTVLFQGDEIPIWQGSAAKRISKPNMKNSLGIAVSVLDYGADPTGVADSTAAFNAATLATTVTTGNDDLNMRRTIDVPSGDYKITGTVYLRLGQHLRGAGEGSTRIMLAGATAFAGHIFKMGVGLINGVETNDTGGLCCEISGLTTEGGPISYAVIDTGPTLGFSIHNVWMISVGIGIRCATSSTSGRIENVQIDQAYGVAIDVGGQNHTFQNLQLYLCNYGIRTLAGDVADMLFTGVQIQYSAYADITFSDGSYISDWIFTNGCIIQNAQNAGTKETMIANRAGNNVISIASNNILFTDCVFANSHGAVYVHYSAASGGNVTFNDCVFEGYRTVHGYDQSTTAYAAFSSGETLTFNNCAFKNLHSEPLYLSGHATAPTIVKVNGGSHIGNAGTSFIAFAATAPINPSSVVINGLDCASSVTNKVFGSANQAGWFLGSDRAILLTGTGISTEITTKPRGPKSTYFVNTQSAAALIRLPTAADGSTVLADGDSLTFIPYTASNWAVNNVKFVRGASTINGIASDYTVSANVRVTITYDAAGANWIVF